MKHNTKKLATMALAGVLSFSAVAPSIAHAAPAPTEQQVQTAVKSALVDILKADGVSQKEWNDYIKFVKDGVANEPTERGGAGGVKKAIKFILKHLDVIPSKTLRNFLQKYGGKVIDAIDTIDTWTWYGIANALMAVGIPDAAADAIADFIVTWLL